MDIQVSVDGLSSFTRGQGCSIHQLIVCRVHSPSDGMNIVQRFMPDIPQISTILQLIHHVGANSMVLLVGIQFPNQRRHFLPDIHFTGKIDKPGFDFRCPSFPDSFRQHHALHVLLGKESGIIMAVFPKGVVDLRCQGRYLRIVFLLLQLRVHHRKGPGAVTHDMIAAILGIVVDTVTGCLHLFLR